jgi:hypothetical protein
MKTVRAWCAAVVFVSIGCGGGGGSSGPSTSADFCMQYAQDVCQISASCAITMSTCVSFQLGQCNAFATAAVAGGVRVYTPNNVNDCLSKVKSAYTGTTVITPSMLTDIDRACNYVWQGKVAQLAGACTTGYDCAGATDGTIICDPTQHLCAPKMTVNSGAQCGGTAGGVCAQDTFCAPNMSNVLVCTAAAKTGDACTTTPCDHTSRCLGGVCAALGQSGEACSASSDCMGSAPYCNPFGPSPVCSLGLQFATLSPSCTCIGQGMGCPAGWTGMGAPSGTPSALPPVSAGGHSGGGAAGGAAGGAGGAAGHAAGGAGGGAAGAAGSGAAGAAGSGAAGAGGLPGVGGLGGV